MVPVAQETTANTVRLPYSFSRRFSLVAWCEASLEILHVHPLSLSVLQELQRGLNAPFTLRQIDEAEFEQRLNAVWQRDSSEARQLMEDLGSAEDFFTLAEELPETEDLLESDDDAPIIKLINAMLAEAIKEGASDIHIETFEKSLVIRFRVDGTLHEMLRPGRKLASLLVSRIKVMARLDIAEKRVPQDGRIALLLGGRAIDVRVSTMPSAWGERVVLRLLDKNQARLTLERLGLSQQLTAQLRQLLHKPHGIFLVTGPTGSGKSTTLYAGLQELNNHSRNILTVEDPIEYMIEGIGQTQVNTRVGMTFARGLRAILRQDPDVVMVGEIRDTETAEIAVQASLTGHLVLSTLHRACCARTEYGAFFPHVKHPHRQQCSATGRHSDRCRRVGKSLCRATTAVGGRSRPRRKQSARCAGGVAPVPPDDAVHDRLRRTERRTGNHA